MCALPCRVDFALIATSVVLELGLEMLVGLEVDVVDVVEMDGELAAVHDGDGDVDDGLATIISSASSEYE